MWRDYFGASFQLEGSEVRISAKAGVAVTPGDGAEMLLRCDEMQGYLFSPAGPLRSDDRLAETRRTGLEG